jgi:diguanylate cyclase (GGDEF)-like protein/PAS domain S-box-containing protein
MGVDNWLRELRLDDGFATLLQLGAIAIVDLKGRILAANPSFADMLGYEPGELTGKRALDLLDPADHERSLELMRQAVAGEFKTISLERRYVRKDGVVFWALLSGAVLRDPRSGQPQFFATLIQDIDAKKKVEFALAAAESRWSFALETAGQGVWDCRIAEGRTFYSPTWKAMLGYSEIDISDASDVWLTLVHPDDLGTVSEADKAHLAGLTPYFECEFRMRHKDGHWVWILDRGKVSERDAEGRPLRMIGTHTDISARRAADDLIRETGERYRLLADNSTDMIMRVRKSGRRIYVSPACRRLLGWEPEEMLSIRTSGALHPDDVEALTDRWISGFDSDEAMILTYRMRRKDGGYIWVESISRALPAVEGQIPERILVVRDIDRRIAAERRLKDSEARYRLLAEYATDMVFQLDSDLVRRYVSPACREILGYEPAELLGISPVAMAHPEDAERVAGVFRSMLSGQLERASSASRVRHRDGRWIWVDAELRLVRDSQLGAPIGIVGSLRDASKRKEAEDRLEQDNRQLAVQAAKDGLTGLSNRRTFDTTLEREFRRARREASHLALIMIDVDYFKAFNDRHGHLAGDACLRSVSQAIASELQRPADCVARYGGEEFAVLLPNTDEVRAFEVAERLRLAVKNARVETSDLSMPCPTISAGVASILPNSATSGPDGLIRTADRALYSAKASGRDAIVAAASLERVLD